ncbi:MAG: multiheme c-type cytochrome [Gammaproteobacteria bacterium]|nr:multiheme c-type cytochrome [Gammaproteobacteria bacterium]
MKIAFRLITGLLFFWAAATAQAQTATVIYSGNLDGELEPCGCSETGNFGGILRRVTVLDELREKNSPFFLLSAGGLIVNEAPQDKNKSEYIFKGFAALNYDAIGVQHNDLAFGAPFMQQAKLPWTVSNSQISDIPAFRDIRKGDTSLRFFQWMSPAEHSTVDNTPVDASSAAINRLSQQLQQARQQQQLTLVASTLTLDEAKKILPLALIDLLIIKANYEIYGEPQKIGDTIVLQPGSRGMRLGRLELQISNGRVLSFKHDVIAMPNTIADAPRMHDWYVAYNNAAAEFFKAKIAKQKNLKDSDKLFAGAQACQSCHRSAYETWQKSKHAEAYYKLMDVEKGYDPDCVGCHVLGLDKPGGFLDPMLTEDMMHVQCENCHGAAKAHVNSGGQTKTSNHDWKASDRCAQCHVQKHSPQFKFDQYWPRIQHGK